VLHFERISQEIVVVDPKTGKKTTRTTSKIALIEKYDREVKELQAEAVIYIVGETLNLFTGENKVFHDVAIRYMATWKKQAKIIDSLNTVHGISREILKILHRSTAPISEMSI
jgi:hypothetical protein